MLQTLLQIGRWQSEGKGKWDRFLDFPKVITKDKKGNKITNYTLPIIFDLDNQEVIIDKENLEEYDEEKIRSEAIPLKVKGGNNKAIYVAVPENKLSQIYKTFFGKEGIKDAIKGELVEAIEKVDSALLTENLKEILGEIFKLKDDFIKETQSTKKNGDTEISIKAINETITLNTSEKIVFIVVKVIAKNLGYSNAILFSEIPDYKTFLIQKYFGNDEESDRKQSSAEKLCYASGELQTDVEELSIDTRYSLNKMFVTETKNYASSFDQKKFNQNYQVSVENQKRLDFASNYLLNEGYKVRIANIDHVIIPQFLSTSDIDLELALSGIQRKSDLLFNMKSLKGLTDSIGDELDYSNESVFWLNFIAFESDGNFFKSTEIIKDVSSFFFEQLIQQFFAIDKEFRESAFVSWDKVMTNYGEPRYFNFNSLYEIIPLRKDKEKKNKALDLFKTVLENRKVDHTILYEYYTELILCHYYERYKSYNNVHQYGKDYFYSAIRDSTFKYLAFFQLLKKLNLIDMEENSATQEDAIKEFDSQEQTFFVKMSFSQEQKAMFYLGRMLSAVEKVQRDKGIKKTVIEKVNFNGMDRDAIRRLRNDLIEKARQHSKVNKFVFIDHDFAAQFSYNDWKLNPQEAVFFLLTGYSFRAKQSNDNGEGEDNNANESENN